MDWEKQHEEAMRDPRVRGDEGEPAPPPESTAGEHDVAEDTFSAQRAQYPPSPEGQTEVGGGLEGQEGLDEEYRHS